MIVPSAMAAVQVGDNLYLLGDFRFRYEIDDEKNGTPDRDRDRARIRARFGFKYDWSKNNGPESQGSLHILGDSRQYEAYESLKYEGEADIDEIVPECLDENGVR